MGRKNKSYSKNLHQQVYDQLTEKLAIGESKNQAKKDGTAKDKIFSFSTYKTYWKHCKYFVNWVKTNHPDCTSLKKARKYVPEWLKSRVDQGLSSWTIQTEAKALGKLYGIRTEDPDYFSPPVRHRQDIKRSRGEVVRDRHFSVKNNLELIHFCTGTGCRRNILEKLEGRDLWTREKMQEEISRLEKKTDLTEKEEKHLKCIKEALHVFPKEEYYVHHRKDKNGRYRFAPIIGNYKKDIIERFEKTGENKKVWLHVNKNADIHFYRGEYATLLYKLNAREISSIPFDKINQGSGKKYQSGVYTCRKDEKGKKLDREAMVICSKALGHNRISVVANNYLREI